MQLMSGSAPTFVDSNVLLYSVDSRDSKRRAQAVQALDELWRSRSGRISWQVLHEFYWNAVKKMGANRDAVRRQVELYEAWQPVHADGEIIRRAWFWETESRISFWDAMIVSAAERCGCIRLLSEDLQAGRRFQTVEVVNPFAA
jgi:predicted nucleic acid-binding protein